MLRRVVAGVAALALLGAAVAFFAWSRGSSVPCPWTPDCPCDVDEPSAGAAATTPSPRAPVAPAPAPQDPSPSAHVAPPMAAAPPPTPRATALSRAWQRDTHDAALLADAERRLGGTPPPELRELVAMRARGATREALAAFIDARIGQDLRVRPFAMSWLRRVSDEPAAAPTQLPLSQSTGRSRLARPVRVER